MSTSSLPRERADRINRPASRARTVDHVSGPPHSAHGKLFAADRHGGYNGVSIVLFWIGVPAIGLLLVATAIEAQRAYLMLNLILSVPMIVYALRRLVRGFPRAPDQSPLLAVTARLATIVMMLALLALGISGPAMVLIGGEQAALFGWATEGAPLPGGQPIATIAARTNQIAIIVLMVTLAIHLLFAVSYAVRGMNTMLLRMRHPVKDGY